MAEPRHLQAVVNTFDSHGEVTSSEQQCPDCLNLEKALRAERAKVTKLKNENARLMGVEPEHETVQEVLAYACGLLMPNATVVPGSKRWMAVRARLKEGFDPLQLRAAACGAVLDDWTMNASQRHRRDPEFVFIDAGKVDRYIQDAVGFKQRTGVSALTLVDELGGRALGWLAIRCSCDGLFIEHLRDVAPSKDGVVMLPCLRTGCPHFDFLYAQVERHLAEAA